MSVVFDTYVSGGSLLHRLDPRAKLWAMVLGLVSAFLLPGQLLPAVLLVTIHLVLLSSGIPWRTLVRLWREMAILILLILFLQPFVRPSGETLLALGPARLTVGGILDAVGTVLRTLNIAFLVGGLLFTTGHRALIQGFVTMGIPYTWGLTISLALRFLPAIQSLFQTVRDAQAARGWMPEGGFFRRIKDHIPILVAVLIGTLRMSDDLTLALAARGLDMPGRRTTWRELRMTARDWAFILLVTSVFGLLLFWRSRA